MGKILKLLAEWFWTDRWTGSSGFLLPAEPRGVYREMLTQAWHRGAKLPNDHEAIQRACGITKDEWKRCWPKIQGYWRVEGDYLVNDTQVAIYADAMAAQQRASDRGARGGRAKAARHHPTQVVLEQNASTTQAPTQVEPEQCSGSAQVLLESKPLSPSLSPTVPLAQNASGSRARGTNPLDFKATNGRPGDFIERFKALHVKHRHGAHYVGNPQKDFPEAALLCEAYDDERLDLLAIVFLNSDTDFAENGTRTIAKFRSMASWCDERLRLKGK